MTEPVHVVLPEQAGLLRDLAAGTPVSLSGTVYTARDATHERLVADLESTGVLPFGLQGHALFYAGPSPAAAGRAVGSVGPTTSSRMDPWTPRLLEAGIVATIGKGARSEEVRLACARHRSVYLATIGGVAALLGGCVLSAIPIAYEELGPEALMRMELDGLPAWVAIDASGNDLFSQARAEWASPTESNAFSGAGAASGGKDGS